jgi:hypothetical protein
MIDRRRALRLALAALPAAALLASPAARAEQAYERLYPLLVDLPGWTGNKPDGMAMQVPGMAMMTATREYRHGTARLNAGIVTGPAAQGGLAMIQSGMKLDTADAHMSTETVDGIKLARTYTAKDKSGAILVGLADNALFSFSFNGVAEDEAFALARRFDWKAIQAALPK